MNDLINEQAACVERVREGERRTEPQVPTEPGFYWFTGCYASEGQWKLVRVFRPCWTDRDRKDLEWSYLDGSGEHPLTGGEWSQQVLPPINTRALPHEPEPKAVAPAESWRMLKVGEVIREGDEVTDGALNDWRPVLSSIGDEVRIKNCFRTRRVAPAPPPTAGPLCAKCRAVMTQEIQGHWICWPCDAKDGAELEQVRQQHAEEVASAKRERDEARVIVSDYATSARVIALHLKDFCNESLPCDMMIAEAARQVAKAYAATREEAATIHATVAELQRDRAAALARQAGLMQQLADIHDLATSSPLPYAERLAAIADRTRPHHTPV